MTCTSGSFGANVLSPLCRVARLGIVLLGLTACDHRAHSSAPDRPGQLTIGFTPADEAGTNEVVRLLTTEGLLQLQPDGGHAPLLASAWEMHGPNNGGRVSLSLREDIVFHDGTPFTAATAKGFLEGAVDDRRLRTRYPSLADIEQVEIHAPFHIDIHLRRPSGFLFDALTLGIYRRDSEEHEWGTGPFIVADRTASTVRLVANQRYHRGRPSIDAVSLVAYPGLRTAWAAMMRGEVDVLHEVPISAREFVEEESDVRLYRVRRPYAFSVGFNRRNSLFDDVRVRQALNHAIDRQAIIDLVLGGDGRPASGIWANHQAYEGVELTYVYDPIKADRLLTAAGFPMPVLEGPGSPTVPSRLEFVCLVPTARPLAERIAMVVQQQLNEVGVHMRLEPLESASPTALMASGVPWDAILVPNQTGRSLSRLYSLWHSSEPLNIYGYSAADDALKALSRASSSADVSSAARAFQQIIYDDPPAMFLVEAEQARAVSRRFVVPATNGRDVVSTIWQWIPANSTPDF